MPRFREVISAIPLEIRLEHLLNDGDSPDIPISIYVDYLNKMRDHLCPVQDDVKNCTGLHWAAIALNTGPREPEFYRARTMRSSDSARR
jgi:hypothetical protein